MPSASRKRMATKQVDPHPTKHDAAEEKSRTAAYQPPPAPAPAQTPVADLSQSGDFARLCQQVQDIKNHAYQTMTPENQARTDALMDTVNAIKNKPFGPR